MTDRTPRKSTRPAAAVSSPYFDAELEDHVSSGSDFEDDVKKVAIASPSRNRTPRKTPTKRQVKAEAEVDDMEDFAPPSNWAIQYDALRSQRLNGPIAPVDTMGCDSHDHMEPKTARLHALISLMLSAQCKDTQNAITMADLKSKLPNGMTLSDLLDIPEDELRELIKPCGLHNRKAGYIKRAVQMLKTDFDGDVPKTIEDLLKLPGVGPKMGYLLLHSAWGITDGIGVDTHVHRISNLLGWVRTNAPEKTRVALEQWLPRTSWKEINLLMVGHGQTICLPRGRMCSRCKLAELGCPSVVAESPRKKIKREFEGNILTNVTEDKIANDISKIEQTSPLLATRIKREIEDFER